MSGLIVFIKNPKLGQCKTRLAATIGDIKALEVYKKLLAHTQEVSLRVDASRYLFYTNFINENDNWSNDHFNKYLQSPGDLGHRMHSAFSVVLANEEKAVIIGSDCPEINSEIINKAFSLLDETDFVIGPTLDGGYYLLGMNKPAPYLFENMKWSVESVFDETVSRILKHQQSYSTLPTLSDLDNEDDLNKFPHFKV